MSMLHRARLHDAAPPAGQQPGRRVSRRLRALTALLAVTVLLTLTSSPLGRPALAATDEAVYYDSLASGWENWSWGSTVSLNSTTEYSGSYAIAWKATSSWGALYFHTDDSVPTNSTTSLRFVLRATQTDQRLRVSLRGSSDEQIAAPVQLAEVGGIPPANSWKIYNIPLAELGGAGKSISGIVIQDGEGTAQPTVYVDDVRLLGIGSTSSGTSNYFSTLPVGAKLPSSAECATRVRRSSWEPRPENYTPNHKKPSSVSLPAWTGVDSRANTVIKSRIDGQFTGTTDEILQWGACKWGFDENHVRAIATHESWWRADNGGRDWTTDPTLMKKCTEVGIPLTYQDGVKGCNQTHGIMQVKGTVHLGTYPLSRQSTAFNVDYALAWKRACYEGWMSWLRNKNPAYKAGDEWGCTGAWKSGNWYDGDPVVTLSVKQPGAIWYIAKVKSHVTNKTWLTKDF